jgi:uncharacterized protein with HEPN domain
VSQVADPRLADYLRHMHEATLRIAKYVGNMSEAGFLADEKTQDAVVRNFEIIGEASNNVVSRFGEFAAVHPEIPWSLAYEMRNALSHGYFKVDLAIVWRTISNDIPLLGNQLAVLLAQQSTPRNN